MLWMAVTADKYELPLAVEESAEALARKMLVTRSTIITMEWRNRQGMPKRPYRGRPNKFGQSYKVVRVKEI